MINVCVSLLIAFSLLSKVSTQKQGKGKRKEKKIKITKQSKKSKSTKSSGKGKKGNGKSKEKVPRQEKEKPKYVFEVKNPVGVCHIEYELFPGRMKCEVDVICWGPIAKVFAADKEVILKTYVSNEIAWVPICLQHAINKLENTQLLELHRHIITYNIFTTKNKLGARAKSEKAKVFFIREEDVDSRQKFVQAFSTDINLKSCEYVTNNFNDEGLMDNLEALEMLDDKKIATSLEFLSNSLHCYQINKIINRVIAGRSVECKEFVSVCPTPLLTECLSQNIRYEQSEKKGKNKTKKSIKKIKEKKKSKKGTKKKKEKGSSKILKVDVPGEVLFTDPGLNIYNLKALSSDITYMFILTSVKKLMTTMQKCFLNPLIIKIQKLSHLPVNILNSCGFHSINVSYNVPYIAQCSSVKKSLQECIKFNEAHAHFTNSLPQMKFFEFMQTQRLYVEIRGIRNEIKKQSNPNLFGSEKEDAEISKRLTARQCSQVLQTANEPSEVTLAVACYDLSSLLKPTWDFKEKASCHHPDHMLFQRGYGKCEDTRFVDAFTINEINLAVVFKAKSLSPLSESLLSDFGTTLKVEVYLSAPHNAMLEVHTNPKIYHRMFVIINYVEIAMSMINDVMIYNQQVFGPQIIIANFIRSTPMQPMTIFSELSAETNMSALTGFVIDNGNSYAIFLEGLPTGFIANSWQQIMNSNQAVVKTFYNSNYCFERRLYPEFMNYGGIYFVNLKIPLDNIMKQQGIYLEGNVPIPCWMALKKLSFLMKCKSSREIYQHNLLPSALEMFSLDLEWGVPFKWKTKSRSDVESKSFKLCRSEDCELLSKRYSTQLLTGD